MFVLCLVTIKTDEKTGRILKKKIKQLYGSDDHEHLKDLDSNVRKVTAFKYLPNCYKEKLNNEDVKIERISNFYEKWILPKIYKNNKIIHKYVIFIEVDYLDDMIKDNFAFIFNVNKEVGHKYIIIDKYDEEVICIIPGEIMDNDSIFILSTFNQMIPFMTHNNLCIWRKNNEFDLNNILNTMSEYVYRISSPYDNDGKYYENIFNYKRYVMSTLSYMIGESRYKIEKYKNIHDAQTKLFNIVSDSIYKQYNE